MYLPLFLPCLSPNTLPCIQEHTILFRLQVDGHLAGLLVCFSNCSAAGSCHGSQQFGWGSLPKMLGLVVISVAALLGCCCCNLVHAAEHFCLASDGGWGVAPSPNAWLRLACYFSLDTGCWNCPAFIGLLRTGSLVVLLCSTLSRWAMLSDAICL